MLIYSGAGNKFVMIDGRFHARETLACAQLCRESGTDGVIILGSTPGYDFSMEFFNPDGSSGMMCGNGGRCIVAFAHDLGIISDHCRFLAPDGEHEASVLPSGEVRLKMRDVVDFHKCDYGFFVDTGARHLVAFVTCAPDVDVEARGKELRWLPEFAPQGVNVNFLDPSFNVRTFEKGVEAETLACGTGITASAIAAYLNGIRVPDNIYYIRAREATLTVEFNPTDPSRFCEVWLTGPAKKL